VTVDGGVGKPLGFDSDGEDHDLDRFEFGVDVAADLAFVLPGSDLRGYDVSYPVVLFLEVVVERASGFRFSAILAAMPGI
jgi:hypothetical protein